MEEKASDDDLDMIFIGECKPSSEEDMRRKTESASGASTLNEGEIEVNDDDAERSSTDDDDNDENEKEKVPLSYKKVEEMASRKTESEELDMLWEEMDELLTSAEMDSMVGNIGTGEASESKGSSSFSSCKHDFYLDEEIGIYCKLCYWIVTNIKDVTPPFVSNVV